MMLRGEGISIRTLLCIELMQLSEIFRVYSQGTFWTHAMRPYKTRHDRVEVDRIRPLGDCY